MSERILATDSSQCGFPSVCGPFDLHARRGHRAAADRSRSQVTAAVRDAIRLLEANQHLDFIKKYMRPSELERQVAKFGSPENVAAEFVKQQHAPLMLKALQAALKLEPAFDSDGTRARYPSRRPSAASQL